MPLKSGINAFLMKEVRGEWADWFDLTRNVPQLLYTTKVKRKASPDNVLRLFKGV